MVYYENSTTHVATHVMGMLSEMANSKKPLIWMTKNIDQRRYDESSTIDFGADIFNVCIFDNISNSQAYMLLHNMYGMDPRFKTVFLCSQNVDDNGIREFFKMVWRNNVLNGALMMWNGSMRIYTHAPFQQNFLVKVFESQLPCTGDADTTQQRFVDLPRNVSRILFAHADLNLYNNTYKVFMKEDPPKVFRVPNRFRNSSRFYFSGRDGRGAFIAMRILRSHWLYHTVPTHYNLINFREETNASRAVDLWGKRVPPDNATVPNLVQMNFTQNFTLA